jgi:hypothetical protein
MAKHNVYVSLPSAELGKKDAFFDIYKDDKKLGTITISKGSIEWYPTNAKKPYKISWSNFDKMIKEYHEQ